MSKKKPWAEDDILMSIDPGSHSCGISLFCLHDKSFVGSVTLSAPKGSWSERLYLMQMQAVEFLEPYGGNIKIIAVELVPRSADPTVQMCAGAIVACLPFDAQFNRNTFVPVATWKKYAREQGAIPREGAKRQDVKGIDAVHDIFGKDFHDFKSDDECDAFLIGLYYLMSKV